jgi:hypothetical protein
MKKLAALALLPMLLLASCDEPTPRDNPATPQVTGETDDSSGLGMTYGGKMGLQIAPGLVMGFDGKISPGFGF